MITIQDTQLLESNGKIITLDKVRYKIIARMHDVIYPIREKLVRAYLDPINKKTKDYLQTKEILRDDFYISLDKNQIELRTIVLHKLGYLISAPDPDQFQETATRKSSKDG